MSDATVFQNVLKSVPEATSLNSTDRLMAFNEAGELKKISRDNILRQNLKALIPGDADESGRWVRIMEVDSVSVGMVWITNIWATRPPIPVSFMYLGTHKSNINSSKVLVFATNPYFPKLRLVAFPSGPYYLELLVKNFPKGNTLTLSVSGNLTVPESFVDGKVPSDAVVKEFDLSQINFGGG